ncbi:MAG: hypothetical protein COT74_03585 [Bdellovibrionales bacterium CG10_big_fil_rev_8_21_14_0_10_45_34]|nr:MAG: hypothetical protein COT74_03585 [Bdellovibrionales bacterium CG10_big_fil_rev_8_21_14_0_10_45_34]
MKPLDLRSSKKERLIYPVITGIALLALHQNCSKARLGTFDQPASLSKAEGYFCSEMRSTSFVEKNVVFVFDMSRSNIGENVVSGSNYGLDTSLGNDLAKARFESANQFIQNCSGPNTHYKIISFSDKLITTPNSHGCDGTFYSSQEASSALQELGALQDSDLARLRANPEDPIVQMKQTNYESALNCLRSILVSENSQKSANQYQVFFITDGAPTMGVCTRAGAEGSTNIDNNCFKQQAQDIVIQAIGKGKSAFIQPIFYHRLLDATPKPPEVASALDTLNMLAEGGRTGGVKASRNLDANTFCEITDKPLSTRYRKESLSVINLTAIMYQGRLEADSDMDGIPDSVEEKFNFDPTNSRTYGILDKLCLDLGGAQLNSEGEPFCLQGIDVSQCKGMAIGMNSCELALLRIAGSNGLDSDSDGIIDFIELIRGSSPVLSDALLDRDGDGWVNRFEIAQGSDLSFWDADLPNENKVMVRETLTSPKDFCPQEHETWQLSVDQIPVAETKKFEGGKKLCESRDSQNGLEKCFDLSHEASENVILFLVRSIPDSKSSDDSIRFWGAVRKVRNTGTLGPKLTSGIAVSPTDFYYLGEERK